MGNATTDTKRFVHSRMTQIASAHVIQQTSPEIDLDILVESKIYVTGRFTGGT